MKKIVAFLLIFIFGILSSQVRKDFNIPKNPKIGLSLAGGGAKGFAHIGVLKILDSLGIKIDYIAGTSMGSIVGGLYASGYTAKDIEKIVMETDFYTIIANEKTRQEATFFKKNNDKYLLSIPIKNGKAILLPKAISTGQKNVFMLKDLFRNVSNIQDFSKLPIPFMCIGTNLETGEMKIFEKGDLVNSIMASSAFPGLMDPVKIGDSLYIDGAITVNYPSKPLKDKGIDIVIGVDLNQKLSKREELNSVISILNQIIDFGIHKDTQKQYEYTDINIHPDLNSYNATSYDDKEKILAEGQKEAKKYISTLKKLPKRESQVLRAPINSIFSNVYKIDSLAVENNHIFKQNYIMGKMNLKIPSMQTYGSINKMIDRLYATDNYEILTYDIENRNNKNILKLAITENDTRFFLKFGLHYDNIFKSGLLINVTAKHLFFNNSTISLDAVLGDKPRYYFNYFIDNGYLPGFGLYSSGMSFELKNQNGDNYDKWKWFRNEVFIQSIWKDKYAIGGGLSFDYFESKLTNTDKKFPDSKKYFNPYVFIKSDTQDDKNFPSKGIYFYAEGKYIDLFNSKSTSKSIQLKADIRLNFPITDNLTHKLKLFGGFSLNNNIEKYYQLYTGEIFEQNLNNFISVPGYRFGSISANNYLQVANKLQYKIRKNFFLIGLFNIGNTFKEIQTEEILKINQISAGITLGYRSPFGQIQLNYSKAFKSDNKGVLNLILGHWF